MNSDIRKLLTSAIAVGFATAGIAGMVGSANAADKSVWNFNIWGGPRAFSAGSESI